MVVVASSLASCAVNRYGRGQYEGMTKTELKQEFKALQYSGVEDRSSIGHPINGAVTVDYVDPKDLAKSEDYIVTTKTSVLDILVGTVTGGLYSQNTIHVRSNMDGKPINKKPVISKPKKVKKKLPITFRPGIRVGSSAQNHVWTEDYGDGDPYVATSKPTVNYIGSFGVEIEYDKKMFIIPSIGFETYNWGFEGEVSDLDTGVFTTDDARVRANTVGLDILLGTKAGRFSIFTGTRGFGFIDNSIKWDWEFKEGPRAFMNGERIVTRTETGEGKINFRPGVRFNTYIGVGVDLMDNLTLDARYYVPTSSLINNPGLSHTSDYDVTSAQLGLTLKL